MPQENQNLTLKSLKTIIMSLKMSGFSYIEPEALDTISAMVKELPSNEMLDKNFNDARFIKSVTHQIGEIMNLINIYGTKNFEYLQRHKSIKNLPPRYKVMDWKRASVNALIKTSKMIDDNGDGNGANKLISLAESILSGDVDKFYENIYRLSQFKVIPQNPEQVDSNNQLTNYQTSLRALSFVNNVLQMTEQINSDITELESILNVGDTSMKDAVNKAVTQAISKTEAYNVLAQMNLISSVESLTDKSQVDQIVNIVNKNISSIQSNQQPK